MPFLTMSAEALLTQAREAALASYSPFSHFRVGAAAIMDGRVFRGTNVENASYGLTCCAERVAIFTGVAAGCRELQAIAVTCIDAPPNSPPNSYMPCGACRQVMVEFSRGQTPVHVDQVRTFVLDELLPNAFTLG